MKRRPEKKRDDNEYKIYFRSIEQQQAGQLKLQEKNIKYRVSGINLVILNWDIPTYSIVYGLEIF